MWTEKKIQFIKNNYDKMKASAISAKLDIPIKKIYLKARQLKLKCNRRIASRKDFFNEDFFSVPNLENSYWAGVIASDGNIYKNRIQIRISWKDINIIKALKIACKYTAKIHKIPSINATKESYIAGLFFNGCDRWIADLNKHWNIRSNKTYNLEPPNIKDQKLILAYLIGFFDGDGCWMDYKIDGYQKYSFGFAGNEKMMLWIKSVIDDFVPGKNITVKKNTKNKGWSFVVRGKRAFNIREKLKLINVPFRLKRKWYV